MSHGEDTLKDDDVCARFFFWILVFLFVFVCPSGKIRWVMVMRVLMMSRLHSIMSGPETHFCFSDEKSRRVTHVSGDGVLNRGVFRFMACIQLIPITQSNLN
jgi:hypothetical protein